MMKHTLIVLALLVFGAAGTDAMAQSERKSAATTEKITHEMLVTKHNFPVMKNTGNPEKDQQQYNAAKKAWIAANPELYKKYNSQGKKASPGQRKALQPAVSPAK